MRLISFLTDLERALRATPGAASRGSWEATRIVNLHRGLARLALSPENGRSRSNIAGGAILLQNSVIANGATCLKATLSWDGAEAAHNIALYSTPALAWHAQAARIAAAWLQGPPQSATLHGERPLAAAAG